MSEILAAMGVTSLESLEEFVAINRRVYELYPQGISELNGIELLPLSRSQNSNHRYIVAKFEEYITKISRDHIMSILHRENVLSRDLFHSGHRKMEPYHSLFPHTEFPLPDIESLSRRLFYLQNGTDRGPVDIYKICHAIRFVIEHRYELSSILNKQSSSGHNRPPHTINNQTECLSPSGE